jgi:DNA gyrase subunit B
MHPKLKKSALEVVMTVLHAGGKFDKDSYKVSGGLHGVGVSCVNALSIHLRAEVHRDGKMYEQEYKQGKPQYDVREIGKTDDRGTIVTFLPDPEIFETDEYKFDILAHRLRELSFLNKGLHLDLVDEREKRKRAFKTEHFYSKAACRSSFWLDEAKTKLIEKPDLHHRQRRRRGRGSRHDVQYLLLRKRHFICQQHQHPRRRHARQRLPPRPHPRVQKIRRRQRFFQKINFTISGEDFMEGLTAIVSVKVPEPQFKGQTKGELGNSEVLGIVSRCVGDALKVFLEENPNHARRIIEKVVLAATARNAARKAREMVQRKGALTGGGCPANWPTAPAATPQKARCSSSRATLQAVRPNRAATATRRLSCRCAVKS